MATIRKVDKKSPEYLKSYTQALDKFYNHNQQLLKNEQKPVDFKRMYIDPYLGKPLIKEVVEAL